MNINMPLTPTLHNDMLIIKEKFHLPAIAVKHGNILGRKIEVVGVVDERPLQVRCIVDNSSKFCRIVTSVSVACETDCLVKQDIAFSIDSLVTVDNLEFGMPLLSDDKESSVLMYVEKPCKIEISSVEYIDSIGLIGNTVHELGVVYIGIGDAIEYGNLGDNINLSVNFDTGFCAAKMCPSEDGHAKVNCCGINGIETSMEFKLFGNATLLGKRHHVKGEFFENSRFAEHVGLRESVPNDSRVAESKLIGSFSVSCGDVCKLAECAASKQLPEHENKQLIPVRELPIVSSVVELCHNSTELPLRQMYCDLVEYVSSAVHLCFSLSKTKIRKSSLGQYFSFINK